MRRLPWHVAFVPEKRALLTACGMALGVAFALLSFSVVGVLAQTSVELGVHLREGEVAIAREGLAPYSRSALPQHLAAVAILIAEARDTSGDPLLVVAFVDDPQGPPVGSYRSVPGFERRDPVIELGGRRLSLDHGGPADDRASRVWPRVAEEDVRRAVAELGGDAITYAVVKGLVAEDAVLLEEAGFELHPAPGVDAFFGTSAREVARAIWLVVLVASVLSAIFAYEFFRTEIRLKRREIAIWRAIGMRARDVQSLLLVRAAALGLLGVAIGNAVAHLSLLLTSRAIGLDLLQYQVRGPWSLLIVLSFVSAAVAGALPATVRASRETLASGLGGAP